MPIQITQQPLLLQMSKSPASLSQRNNGKLILDLEINEPELEMQTKLPKVKIDQTEPFAEAGLKNMSRFLADNVSYSKQIVQEGIGRIVDQGNEWIDIHTGNDPIPDQAIYNAYDMFLKEFNLGTVPRTPPKISLDEGQVSTRYNKGSVVNHSKPQKIEMHYTPYQMEIAVKQYNSIHFNYVEPQYDFMV